MKKHVILTLVLACCFCVTTPKLFATNYYSSPDGTGDGLSISTPCAITSAWGKLTTPGDTLFLRGGIYYINAKQSINKTGTADNRICIFAYPSETPILDFSGQPYGSSNPGISLNSGSSYMHIKGIVVRYAGDNGIINNGNYHIIENCVFYGNCDTGLQHKEGGGNLIKNCDSYNNFDYQTGGTGAADFGGNADGFADKQFTNTNPNTYDGCRAWNNSDDGWDLFQRVGNVIIKNCICYQNGPATYNLTNHPRATTDAAWFANFPMTVTNADAGTDYVTLTSYTNYGNGNGFKLGGDYTDSDVTVTNCLSVANTVRGYDQNNNYGTMTLYNNTAYRNGRDYGFGNSGGGILIIKNCVSLASLSANQLSTQTVTNVNNSWNTSGVTCDAADFESIDTTLILTPRQADGSLTVTTFMHLVDGSDLIDAGTAVSLPFSGSAIDLGCYEKGVIDQFPGTVTTPGNKTQTITEGGSIENIVFTWGDGATGLEVTGLPAGINSSIDNEAKTLTLSGTPTESGVFNYTVSTVGGTTIPATVSGKIVISSATGKKIAYVTTPDAAADVLILDKLYANTDFSVTIEPATTVNDYSGYDLIILSPVPGSNSAGLDVIETVDKPKLLLKPFQLKNTEWNWGVAANTTEKTITVTNPSHVIFNGITLGTSNELELFSAVGSNGVTMISSWVGTPGISEIATPVTAAGQTIVEIPVGTDMNGTVTTQRFLMLGVSEYSTANLTSNATKLIENACYYLLGMTVPGDVKLSTSKKVTYIQTENEIIIQTPETISSMKLFNTSGITLKNCKNTNRITISDLPKGVYLLRIDLSDYQTKTIKFIK